MNGNHSHFGYININNLTPPNILQLIRNVEKNKLFLKMITSLINSIIFIDHRYETHRAIILITLCPRGHTRGRTMFVNERFIVSATY